MRSSSPMSTARPGALRMMTWAVEASGWLRMSDRACVTRTSYSTSERSIGGVVDEDGVRWSLEHRLDVAACALVAVADEVADGGGDGLLGDAGLLGFGAGDGLGSSLR
jgi:hypothetical protein